MPISQLLRSHGFFNPETTKSLTAAFDTAWQILKTSGSTLTADYQSASTRELLAKRIIEMANQGERDPLRLVDDALAHLAKSTEALPRSSTRAGSSIPAAPGHRRAVEDEAARRLKATLS